MENKIFVTTFNRRLFDQYAHQLISSYVATEQKIPLYVFVEDDITYYTNLDNVRYIKLLEEEPDLKDFTERNKSKEANSFTFDAVRFSYKVYAQNAGRKYGNKIYYVDSDCVFTKQIPDEWFDECLPDDKFISFYDRPHQYTETGFVAFNERKKEISNDFFNQYTNYYKTDEVYKLTAYTDCHTLDATRNHFKDNLNYSENILGDGKNGHIMARDKFLNPYIDHRKGPRKQQEHSLEWIQNQ